MPGTLGGLAFLGETGCLRLLPTGDPEPPSSRLEAVGSATTQRVMKLGGPGGGSCCQGPGYCGRFGGLAELGPAKPGLARLGDHRPAQAALHRAGQNLNRGVWLLLAAPSWTMLTRSAILRLRGERQLSALSVARDRRGQPSGLPSVPRPAARPASQRRPHPPSGRAPGSVSNCADDAWHAFRSLKSTFPPCGVRVPGWPAHLRRGRSLPTRSTASWRGARRVIPKAIPGLGWSAHLLRHLTPGAPARERQALPGPGSSAITLPGQWCCPGDQARSRHGHRSWP